jgi:hypothetical protein
MNRLEKIPFAQSDIERLDALEMAKADGETRMNEIEAALKRNTEVTVKTAKFVEDNSGILLELSDAFKTARGGFKVLGWLGTVAKWLGGVSAAGMALWGAYYAATHGGKMP